MTLHDFRQSCFLSTSPPFWLSPVVILSTPSLFLSEKEAACSTAKKKQCKFMAVYIPRTSPLTLPNWQKGVPWVGAVTDICRDGGPPNWVQKLRNLVWKDDGSSAIYRR